MSRPFRFKRFNINQHRAAMKVGTDGVLLGAWCSLLRSDRRALDIGTGTGLIALMLAQRGENILLNIDAIEIDHDAYLDAAENIVESPWPDRINIMNESLQNFATNSADKYDLIACNPPFFIDSLPAPDASRTLARHAVSLTYSDLLACAVEMLAENGRLNVVIPFLQEEKVLESASKYGLALSRLTRVYPKPGTQPKRSLIELSHTENAFPSPHTDILTIELSSRHDYSPEYIALTADFYLKF